MSMMCWNENKRSTILVETIIGISTIISLIYVLRYMLVYGETTLVHDSVLWGYPTFQYYAESIMNGNYPLWNPFSHGGEPFYPILIQRQFFDPVLLLVIYLGQYVTKDIVMLFNWSHFVQSLIMVFGLYIVLRQWANNLFIRLTLVPILLYSSIMLGSLRQPGILDLFVWAPYIVFFLLRIIYYKNYGWHSWLALAGLVGLNWQSYCFTGYWIFLLFILLGIVFFRRDLLGELFRAKAVVPRLAVASAIVLLMMVPNIVLMLEKGKYVFPARMISTSILDGIPQYSPQQYEGNPTDMDEGMRMSYRVVSHTGTFSTIWDFIQIISPDGNRLIGWSDRETWGKPSEAFIYLGILPWSIAILGMVFGRHDLKRVWFLVLIGFGLLILGPAGGLHRLLYYIYPPLWFVRHTHLLVLFFVFSFLYFYVLGFNHIFSTWRTSIFRRKPPTYNRNHLSIQDTDSLKCIEGTSRGWLVENINKIRARVCCLETYNYRKGRLIPILIFSIISVVSVHRMTKLRYPETNHLFCYIILIVASGWFLRKLLGRNGLYISVIVTQLILVLVFSRNRAYFLIYLFLVFIIPLILFSFFKAGKYSSRNPRNYKALILSVIFIICLMFDLIYSLTKTRYLYNSMPHPGLTLNIETTSSEPFLLQKRSLVPYAGYFPSGQSIRYLSLLYRKPFVFSPLYDLENKSDDFEYVLKSKRWNSFLLPDKYFNLIHSGIPPQAMKEMFAVDAPMFQYKRGVVMSEDKDTFDLLKQLGADKSSQLLRDYVLVDKSYESSLSGAGIPVIDYRNIAQSAYAINNGSGEGDELSYNIENYKHNSFDMDVSVDEAGVLYWSDGYDKWWRAYVNGKAVPVYRANVNFKAIVLSEGENNIRFVYKPIWFRVAFLSFYGTLIMSSAAALCIIFRDRRIVNV